jgi:hypothetical protein
MSKIVISPESLNLSQTIFRYMEGDDEIKDFLIYDTLPQAKKALQKIFEEKLEEIQHLKLRDLT